MLRSRDGFALVTMDGQIDAEEGCNVSGVIIGVGKFDSERNLWAEVGVLLPDAVLDDQVCGPAGGVLLCGAVG